MRTTVVIPANEEPVSLNAAKNYLRIGHDDEDGLLTDLITGARARIERSAGLSLVTRTLRVSLDCWPDDFSGAGLRLRPGPVRALSAVRAPGTSQNDVTARFRLYGEVLKLRPFQSPPVLSESGVEIDFEAGFGASSDVPADLVLAVKLAVAHAFQRRRSGRDDEDAEGLPAEVRRLLRPYREARI